MGMFGSRGGLRLVVPLKRHIQVVGEEVAAPYSSAHKVGQSPVSAPDVNPNADAPLIALTNGEGAGSAS